MTQDTWYDADIERVVVTEGQLRDKIDELARQVAIDYARHDNVLLVGVLKGAFATSSGVVRILKDLDRDIAGQHVIVVEDIVDTGLTLSWLLKYLQSRSVASLEVVALLRKPDAVQVPVAVRYVGFEIPNDFVVGYGLDYAERYREVPFIGVLKPAVYARA